MTALGRGYSWRSLEDLEMTVELNKGGFLEAVLALSEIEGRELYRERGYENFLSYCQDRFDLGLVTTRNYLRGLEAYRGLDEDLPPGVPRPDSISVSQDLSRVPREERPGIWQEAVSEGKTSRSSIRKRVKRYKGEGGTPALDVYHSLLKKEDEIRGVSVDEVAAAARDPREIDAKIEACENLADFYFELGSRLRTRRDSPAVMLGEGGKK
jgi:hypothetical protein